MLSVSRRPSGHAHSKLAECLVPDFRELAGVEPQLTGYDACFYCAGVSSIGMPEAEYAAITYDTGLHFAQTVARLNPGMVVTHVSGAHTDSSERGKVMWARVKGRAENALGRLPFKAVYNFRPSLMKPAPGQRNIKRSYRVALVFYPLLSLFFPAIQLRAGRPCHDQLRPLRRAQGRARGQGHQGAGGALARVKRPRGFDGRTPVCMFPPHLLQRKFGAPCVVSPPSRSLLLLAS